MVSLRVQRLRSKVLQLTTDLAAANVSKDEAVAQLEVVGQELTAIEAENDQLSTERDELTAARDQLRTAITDLETTVSELTATNQQLTSENTQVKSEVESLKASVEDKNGQITTLTESNVLLTNTVADLKTKLEACKVALADCQNPPAPEPEPTTKLFPGHVPGQISFGWCIEGSLKDYQAGEEAKLSAIAPARSRPAKAWREFSELGSDVFGSTGDGYLACKKGQWVFITWAVRNGDMARKLLSGGYDTWIDSMVNRANQMKSEFNARIMWNIDNESDGDSIYMGSAENRELLRKSHRYLYKKFKEKGVTNLAASTITYIPMTFHDSDERYRASKGGSGRKDGWWEYHPDWKGTLTNWSNGWTPNKEDFYWGTDKTVDLLATNQYCWHGMGGTMAYDPANGVWGWNETEFRSHDLLGAAGSKHMEYTNRVNKNLYGDKAALAIGELGWTVFENRDRSFPDVTASHWSGKLVDELLEANTVLVTFWKQVKGSTAADIATSALASGGRHTESGAKGQVDAQDSRRKGWAATLDRPEARK